MEVRNHVMITGVRLGDFKTLSTDKFGEKLKEITMSIVRLSGVEDHIKVVIPTSLLSSDMYEWDRFTVVGQVRTRHQKVLNKNLKYVYVYAKEILVDESGEDMNDISLIGTLKQTTTVRETGTGRQVASFVLLVKNGYQTYHIPCVAWGKSAYKVSETSPGVQIKLTGRMQSRGRIIYDETGEEKESINLCEVSIARLEVEHD